MTPVSFVAVLSASVRQSTEAEADYFAAPPTKRPPAHLARFSAWFQRLSAVDQEIAREVIGYAAEGSLFTVLTCLDNIASLTDEGGAFELWYTSAEGARIRLNDPDGELLTDIFNDRDKPGSAAD